MVDKLRGTRNRPAVARLGDGWKNRRTVRECQRRPLLLRKIAGSFFSYRGDQTLHHPTHIGQGESAKSASGNATHHQLTNCGSWSALIFAVAVILVIKSKSDYRFDAPTIQSPHPAMECLESWPASTNGASETWLSFLVYLAGCDMRDYSELVAWISNC
jgi:hypothetical protein